MSGYYDREGNPITLMEWAASVEDHEAKRVAFDQIGTTDVSTVWLGLDHRFGEGPPLIFETMVFGGDFDGEQDRYSTEAQAVAGHARMVGRVKGGRS